MQLNIRRVTLLFCQLDIYMHYVSLWEPCHLIIHCARNLFRLSLRSFFFCYGIQNDATAITLFVGENNEMKIVIPIDHIKIGHTTIQSFNPTTIFLFCRIDFKVSHTKNCSMDYNPRGVETLLYIPLSLFIEPYRLYSTYVCIVIEMEFSNLLPRRSQTKGKSKTSLHFPFLHSILHI